MKILIVMWKGALISICLIWDVPMADNDIDDDGNGDDTRKWESATYSYAWHPQLSNKQQFQEPHRQSGSIQPP
jgi:hypothetical protein